MKTLRIATRKSPLARWQAEFVKTQLQQHDPQCEIDIVGLSTRGDEILDRSLAKIGGKGLFIKELENALLEDRADLAVHSMKDLPPNLPSDFSLVAITQRATVQDAFVSSRYSHFTQLPSGACVGTSSLRRQSQLLHLRSDLDIQPLRGNVQTRLRKLDDGQFDAIILAAVGLQRLGLASRIQHCFDRTTIIPACGQGALGIECLSQRRDLCDYLNVLNDPLTQCCIETERMVVQALNGSCQLPLGVHAYIEQERLQLHAIVGQADGQENLVEHRSGPVVDNEQLAHQLTTALLAQGAQSLIDKAQVHD